MNEYQRQAYLSALGVDNYMPRWRLPFAPESMACELPAFPAQQPVQLAAQGVAPAPVSEPATVSRQSPAPIADVLRDIAGEPKLARSASLTQTLASTAAAMAKPSAQPLQPFSLSIWRPQHPLLIIAERHARSALPVEPLVHNILRSLFSSAVSGSEEVLRWPLVENSRVSQSAEDARIALQTWLEAELARRPVPLLWLMGAAAASYFLPADSSTDQCLWQLLELDGCQALVTPDPVELLQQPLLKRQLWMALQPLLSV